MVDVPGAVGQPPTWTWVLAGVGAYWLAIVWLRRTGRLPGYVGTQGPILTLHTRRFRAALDRLARPRRLWRAWGNLGIGVALVVMATTFAFLAVVAYSQFTDPPPPSAVNQPANFLVIPGVNEFLPLSVAPEIVLGLLVGLVVHEGGHGLFCRVGDIEIESMGLALLGVIPIGAFVEPDDDSRRAADRGDQTRMFAAGVTNNFAITLLAYALLFGPVVGAIGVAPGAAVGGVFPGSSAHDAGIGAGDRIVEVAGQPIDNNTHLESTLATVEERRVRVRLARADGTETVTVDRAIQVVGAWADGPFTPISAGDRIVAVDGTPVRTKAALDAALAGREVATLTTADGESVSAPIGAAVNVTDDGPAARAGVPTGPAVVSAVDGERIASAADLGRVLGETSPGQSVAVTLYVEGERQVHEVRLGEHPEGQGLLGVRIAEGVSGLALSDFGARLYPSADYLSGLRWAGDSFWGNVGNALFLPFASVLGGPYNFAGFTGGVANFYRVVGVPGALAGLVFGLANGLFWTGWINLNLAFFNCIPAFPLDGGHILRSATEAVVSRLPVRDRRRLTTAVTTSVGLLMLASLLILLFGPQLLR